MAKTMGPNSNHDTTKDEDWGAQLFDAEFANNPDPRCPCILLLDISRSMNASRTPGAEKPIDALNQGIRVLREELLRDSQARQRVEIAIVTFGDTVDLAQPFVTPDSFTPPLLQATGRHTLMGQAILAGLKLLEERKEQYKKNGVIYYRPWLFLITDGAPQGEPLETTRQAVQQVKAAEAARKVVFFAVGVEGANMKLLGKIANPKRPPVRLRGLQFNRLFQWLSKSAEKIAHSQVGEMVPLPPVDWGTA